MPPHLASVDALGHTIIATGTIAERRFVTFAAAQAGLDGVVLGISKLAGIAGDAIPLTLVGTVDMVAGADITAGADLVSNVDGLPIPKGANTNVAGKALTAGLAGQRVAVLLR
ncbi:hypothetical protein V5G24_00190 [Xanthobacter sp. VTT E-85241]|uniref:hypothetical protein n=1 Tax=Roseixanthobacter finlandensis TaxID=3119922 RepID=UPI00372B7ACF